MPEEEKLILNIKSNYYCLLTCAHNLIAYVKKGQPLLKCEDIRIMLGK